MAKKQKPRLSELESNVMDVVWAQGSATADRRDGGTEARSGTARAKAKGREASSASPKDGSLRATGRMVFPATANDARGRACRPKWPVGSQRW